VIHDYSNAFDDYSNAFDDYSDAFGDYSDAFDDYSDAFGDYGDAFSDYSNAFGDYSDAFGDCSGAFGDYSGVQICRSYVRMLDIRSNVGGGVVRASSPASGVAFGLRAKPALCLCASALVNSRAHA
jgi:hypothetical protein